MKFLLKLFVTLALLIVDCSCLAYFIWYKPKFKVVKKEGAFTYKPNTDNTMLLPRLKMKALVIKEYSRSSGFNNTYFFMVDIKIASSKTSFLFTTLSRIL